MRRMMSLLGAVAMAIASAVVVSGAGSAGSRQERWMIRDLGVLRGIKSEALAINEGGQVVGYAVASDGASHAFLWQAGRMRDLDVGYAVAINDHGQIVGYKDVGDNRAAILWENGKARALASSGGTCASTMASAISGSGQAVGWGGDKENCSLSMSIAVQAQLWEKGKRTTLAPMDSEAVAINERGHVVVNVWDRQALVWRNGRTTTLGTLGGKYDPSYAASINERGQIVGYSRTAMGERAFLWQKGKMRDLGTLPGAKASFIMGVTRVGDMNFSNYHPEAINDRGQVVGTSATANGTQHPFLWQNGGMTDLGILPGGKYSAQPSINERGQIVGTISSLKGATTVERAYVWQNGMMTDLGTLGGPSSFAAAINDHGQIVGSSTTKTGQTHAVLWTMRRGT